jgi:hypothetical protein
MSVISGGIFSKPRGKTGGIVFGAARTRQGKLATARELVKPSNPNTALQQTQRGKFKSALDLVRRIGSTVYRTAWNRSVGQLPGFQSMISIFLGQMAANKDITLVNDINLGLLHFPDTFSIASGAAGRLDVTWSGSDIGNGTDADKSVILAFAKTDTNRQASNGVAVGGGTERADEEAVINGLISGETYEVYFYFEGVGNAAGLYSLARAGSTVIS